MLVPLTSKNLHPLCFLAVEEYQQGLHPLQPLTGWTLQNFRSNTNRLLTSHQWQTINSKSAMLAIWLFTRATCKEIEATLPIMQRLRVRWLCPLSLIKSLLLMQATSKNSSFNSRTVKSNKRAVEEDRLKIHLDREATPTANELKVISKTQQESTPSSARLELRAACNDPLSSCHTRPVARKTPPSARSRSKCLQVVRERKLAIFLHFRKDQHLEEDKSSSLTNRHLNHLPLGWLNNNKWSWHRTRRSSLRLTRRCKSETPPRHWTSKQTSTRCSRLQGSL